MTFKKAYWGAGRLFFWNQLFLMKLFFENPSERINMTHESAKNAKKIEMFCYFWLKYITFSAVLYFSMY